MTDRRRSKGEGSVFWREDRQRWMAVVDYGYVDGKRKRVTRGFVKKAEATRWRTQALVDQARGLPPQNGSTTVGGWLRTWLDEDVARSNRAGTTVATYRSLVETHLIPRIGRKVITKLTHADVATCLTEMATSHSQSTLQQVKVVLKSALDVAVRQDLLARNVAAQVQVPKSVKPTKVVRPLTLDQRAALFTEVAEHPLGPLVVLTGLVGLRRGEGLALRWTDLKVEEQTLHVGRQVVRGGRGEGLLLVPPKAGSVRTIQLPAGLVSVLTDHRRAQRQASRGDGWNPSGLMFPSPEGGLRDPSSVNRVVNGMYRRAGVDQTGLHPLRHTAGTVAHEVGVDMTTVAAMFGHKSLAVTDKYVASTAALRGAAAEKIGATMAGVLPLPSAS